MQTGVSDSAVVDSSTVIASLSDGGRIGEWARNTTRGLSLSAPHVMPAEVAAVLRRQVARGRLTADSATLAHLSLTTLSVELFAYEPFAARVWQLRDNVTPYDAWYVALAETLDAPLLTLDLRLARSLGPRCEFRIPPIDTIQTGME